MVPGDTGAGGSRGYIVLGGQFAVHCYMLSTSVNYQVSIGARGVGV